MRRQEDFSMLDDGTIQKVNEDGSYVVDFDTGDADFAVEPSRLIRQGDFLFLCLRCAGRLNCARVVGRLDV